MEKVIVTIKPDGTFEYDVQGATGSSCDELTAALDKMGRVLETEHKPEYNRRQLRGQGVKAGKQVVGK